MECLGTTTLLSDVIDCVRAIRLGKATRIEFLRPAHISVLACESLYRKFERKLISSPDNVKNYAKNSGLYTALAGEYQPPLPGGTQGFRYTKLTRLSSPAEVEYCNQVVSDLIEAQFSEYSARAVSGVRKVVGELHDNVASHASGTGYSCAQVYEYGGRRHLYFAIADGGVGLLKNSRMAAPQISTDVDAIEWCLKRGNTSARREIDPMAQRLPDDAVWNPYPERVQLRQSDDHHAGEGLWQLMELVKRMDGSLEILSGDALWRWNSQQSTAAESRIQWEGVAISFDLVIPNSELETLVRNEKLDQLAGRLGL